MDTKEKTRQLLEDICLYIKACHGYLYGSIIREFTFRENVDIGKINCRIDMHLMSAFVQVLSVNYDVINLPLSLNNTACISKRIIASCKDNNEIRVIVDLCLLSENDWLSLPCNFDVNILAENSNKQFLRFDYVQLERFPDKLSHIRKRILDGRFALLDTSSCKSMPQFVSLIDNASNMVHKGWEMDDIMYGEQTWVVNRWIKIKDNPCVCRKSYSRAKVELMTSLNECPLCSDRFADNDIVINTKCNHNFHWHNPRCKGLSEWMMRGNVSCPVCRKNTI